MNIQSVKASYIAPKVEAFLSPKPLSLLVSVSIEAGIEDWEEGDEL